MQVWADRVTLTTNRLIAVAVLLLLIGPGAGEAQPTATTPRIGFLWTGSPESSTARREAFERGLRELGHVNGRNIVVEYRYAEERLERLPALAAEIVGLKPDIILAHATPAIAAAKRATSTIPIVMVNVADPVSSGFVDSLSKPGGNLTGLTLLGVELSAKRLELLKEIVPKLSRVAVFWEPGGFDPRRTMVDAARELGIRLHVVELRGPNELASAFAEARRHADALVVLPSATLGRHQTTFLNLAERHRLPTTYHAREFVEAGGLMAYGPDLLDMARRAAIFADKILRGSKPGDLPVEQPTKFELVINRKTAKALGLTISPSLLLRADHVIE